MSLIKYVDVTCDECHTDLDGGGESGVVARANARFEGWRVGLPGGRDLCPVCAGIGI